MVLKTLRKQRPSDALREETHSDASLIIKYLAFDVCLPAYFLGGILADPHFFTARGTVGLENGEW